MMAHGDIDTTRTNRLAGESSPYLLLHRHNPVDWYPWGPEALDKARREGKPIFLSVGYSTCYWCHVMERESFSDPDIARLLNQWFVSIKVDREERPDLDDVYMTATQILTQHGGWPNSVFLTPDLKPFYAGTYFPPEDRYGRPGFRSLLENLHDAWSERGKEVALHAQEVAQAMERYFEGRWQPTEEPPGPQAAERSFEALSARFDPQWGGFGSAPKFPSPSNLYLLLELASAPEKSSEAADMLHQTLDQMARGGIYDQLAGGFHRYATDREWKIPHFEKMLYDNGFLLEVYALEHARTGDPEMARIARETAGFVAREMTGPHGAFLSAIDAETDGKEGAYYVWSRHDLEQVIGAEDAEFLAPLYGFDGEPFFEGDEYVLHLPVPLAAAAEARKLKRDELLAEIEPLRRKLLAARSERERPLTDDKVLADWNGIAITGMAAAGRVLGEPERVEQAARAARFVLREMRPAGVLLHVWRDGEAKLPAFLADYVFMVRGLLALHEATGDGEWLAAAEELAAEQIERLKDPAGGFFNADEAPDLLFRPKDMMDGAMPAANSVAALNFIELARRTEDPAQASRWRLEAAQVLRSMGGLIRAYPDAARMATVAAARYGGAGSAEPAAPGPLEGEARSVVAATARYDDAAGEGGARSFRLTLEIEPGWHLQANPASEADLVATRVEAKRGEVRNVDYPAGRSWRPGFTEAAISVYEGTVELAGELDPSGDGEPVLLLTYQPCDEARCLPPVTREVPLG